MMNRRCFVRCLPVLTAGATAAGTLTLTACASVRYAQARESDGRLLVRRSDMTGFSGVFVQSGQLAWPIYLHESATGSYSAVAAHCTHRGCQPEPEGDRLVCPCHGSEFAFTGSVLRGPAERPLDRYDVSTEGDDLVIWLSRKVGP